MVLGVTMKKYVLKVDVDLKLPKKWIELFKKSRKGMLESLGFKVTDIVIHPSSRRGFHAWFHIESKKPLNPKDLAYLQFLCGDDKGRFLLNLWRIKRGISWKRANKMFSEVLWRRDTLSERCKKCGLFKAAQEAKEYIINNEKI